MRIQQCGTEEGLTKILICIVVFGLFLYSYVDMQNNITRRRLEIPVLAKEIKDLKEANTHLQYEIDIFRSPEHLMDLARHSEYSHLKQPMLKEILNAPEGLVLTASSKPRKENSCLTQAQSLQLELNNNNN